MGAVGAATYIAAGTAVATTAYSASKSDEARSAADDQAKAQQKKQNQLMDAAKAKDAQNQTDMDRDAALQKQKMLGANAGGRDSTILTSPLGVTTSAAGSNKTLLGM